MLRTQKTLHFLIISYAFIFLAIDTINFYIHGFIGFVLLVIAAYMLKSSNENNYLGQFFFISYSKNKWIVILSIWYFCGVVFNGFIGGNGLEDWIFFPAPLVFLFAFVFVTSHLFNRSLYRFFIIRFIILLGIHSLVIIPIMVNNPEIARDIFVLTHNGIALGGPDSFSLQATLVPIFFWQATQEKGKIRIILIISICAILISIAVSAFTTAALLIIVIAPLFYFLYFILIPINNRYRKQALMFSLIFFSSIYIAYDYTKDNPLFDAFFSRTTNVIADPTSGGYDERNRDESRYEKNLISYNSFIENPLLGNGSGNIRYNKLVGGHSSFFDSLAAYGVFGGGGAFVALVFLLYRNAFRKYRRYRNFQTLASLVSVSLFVIGGIVNPYWEGFQPAFILLLAQPFVLSKNT